MKSDSAAMYTEMDARDAAEFGYMECSGEKLEAIMEQIQQFVKMETTKHEYDHLRDSAAATCV
jgi:hypothetical protein